ncbi:hypothetical protein D3C81_1377270 [compost metagenome]
MLGHLEVFPDVGVEDLEALELRQVVPARIVEILEAAIAGFIGVVVPVFEAQERALALAIETEIGEALEKLRDGIALLEVQPVVIGADAAAIGIHALGLQGIGAGHQAFVGILRRPTAAQAQAGPGRQAPVFVEVKGGGAGRPREYGNNRQRKRLRAGMAKPVKSLADSGCGRAFFYHYWAPVRFAQPGHGAQLSSATRKRWPTKNNHRGDLRGGWYFLKVYR